jgi:hypothetical protein
MSLVKELIRPLLEEEKKVVAVYGGGFKPPTAGHFEVVDQALKENPNIDEFIILIGGKERDGISPEESLIIWDIYKQYLPIKVEVKLSSKPPIQAVYNYAKEHPNEEVLFVIGAREGNEDDFSDIAKRTKSLDKYNNLELRTIITQGGASGTAARNAAKISVEKLKPLLPKQLKDEEVEEVYELISDKVTEIQTPSKEKDVDPKELKMGIKVEMEHTDDPAKAKVIALQHLAEDPKYYTKLASLGLEENKQIKYTNPNFSNEWEEAIRYPEFEEMGKEKWIEIANKGKAVSYSSIKDKLGNVDLKFDRLEKPKKQRFNAAYEKGVIEMSIAVKFDDSDYDLIAGNTRLAGLVRNGIDPKIWVVDISQKQTLNEVLDPKTFDFKPLLISLTKSMEKDGLKLKPYPKVKFVHDAEANAEDFFGKTAYYAPGNNTVVLYTLGRHPKDIMRSYAHELIHVHQNHEDRLDGINTDDVNEDDYLEKIEREAYENGNIMFRSWTNKTLNEGKKKDPFGISAFARELALGLEEQEEGDYYIYLDMDGVVADFDKRFKDLSGMLPQEYVDKNGLNAFWDLIDEKHKVAFWRGIELMPGAQKLVKYIEQHPFEMLTAPSIKKQSIIGKGLWVKDKVGTLYSTKPKVTYRKAKLKHTVKPQLTKYDILIDDKASTIDTWNSSGGTAILYQSADQVINDLKQLGL